MAGQANNIAGNGQVIAERSGLAQLYKTVQNQASALSYLDVFKVLMVMAVVMFAASFLLKGNKPGEDASGAM